LFAWLEDEEEGMFPKYFRLFDKLFPELTKNSINLACNGKTYQIPKGKIVKTEKHQGDYVFETTEILKVDYENMITEEKLLEYGLTVAEMREMYPKGVRENITYKRINLNSPFSIKHLTNRNIDFENVYDGVVFAAQDLFDEWIAKYPWKLSTGYGAQNLNNIKYLEQSLIKYGELDIRKPNEEEKNVLYYIPLKSRSLDSDGHITNDRLDKYSGLYYNHDEIAYWVWGYIAKRLNFTKNQAIAYGMLYLDKPSIYDVSNYSIDNRGYTTVTGTPWMARAIMNGFEYPSVVSPPIIDKPYSLEFEPIVEMEDIITIALFIPVVGEGAIATKVTIQMSVKVLTAAYINWQVQILINIMGGMTYEEAVKNVDYTEVTWEGITSIMKNEKLFIGLECLFASVQKIRQTNEFDFNNNKKIANACFLELLKHSAFKKLISDNNSIFYYYLEKSLRGNTAEEVIYNLKKALNCTDSQIAEIMAVIPVEFFDTTIRNKK
jgi:hypothetical protein